MIYITDHIVGDSGGEMFVDEDRHELECMMNSIGMTKQPIRNPNNTCGFFHVNVNKLFRLKALDQGAKAITSKKMHKMERRKAGNEKASDNRIRNRKQHSDPPSRPDPSSRKRENHGQCLDPRQKDRSHYKRATSGAETGWY